MTDVADLRPILAPAISFACAALVFASRHRVFWRAFWSLSAAGLKLAVVASMLPGVLDGTVYAASVVHFPPGLSLSFRVDGLAMFFGLVSSTLWLLTTIYAIGFMREGAHLGRFFGFFALCVSTTVAIAFAENLLTLFVFYELLTVCTYPLVVHSHSAEARRAGHRYLAYLLTGGGLVLVGTVLTFSVAGTLTFAGEGILPAGTPRPLLAVIFVALVAGFGVKAAIMPLHAWLPAAMVAPVPVSALLHAVAVVKVGAFGVMRVVYQIFGIDLLRDLGWTDWLAALAGVTIVAGSLLAIRQDNLKRRLAYSTISQVAYILLAVSVLSPLAAVAGIAHLANQAFAKITMFFVAGIVERTTHRTRVREFAGMGARLPWTMAAFTISALSFMGLPLFAGFVTKWYLFQGALQTGAWWFAVVLAVSSVLNAICWLPILYLAWFQPARGTAGGRVCAPAVLVVPTLVCAAYVILLGTTYLVPGAPLSLARAAAEGIFAP